uniref:Nuclear protein 1 n=1 Tax=Scolopendra viridis TaxID=118503 RepID=A0A4D5R9U5_SCOVI
MSESHLDEYDRYNFEYDKYLYSGHSGKQRSKREVSEHTNHFDPSGHARKIVTKLHNTESNKKKEAAKPRS